MNTQTVKEYGKIMLKWFLIIMLVLLVFTIKKTQVIAIVLGMCMLAYSIGKVTPALQHANIGFSFVKLMGMLLMYWYNPFVAIIAIPFIQVCEFFGQNYWKTPVIIQIPNRMLMPLYGFWIVNFNIAWAGLVLLLITDLIEYVGVVGFLGKNAGNSIMYYLTDFMINFPLIWQIGPLLVAGGRML